MKKIKEKNNYISIKEFLKNIQLNNIESTSKNIFELFDSENVFQIKSFQRKYDWSKTQSKELINDIWKNEENMKFFLGTIILKKYKKNREIRFSVVDGQQRITTLFLILKSIEFELERYKDEDTKELKNKIKKSYLITFKNNSMERLKIEGIRNNRELEKILKLLNEDEIENLLSNIPFNNPLYLENFNEIRNHLKNLINDLIKIKDMIKKIEGVVFAIIGLGESLNENQIFEDLNSKGAPLKIQDLLRNYFHSKINAFNKNLKNSNPITIEQIDRYEYIINDVEQFLIKEKREYRSLFASKINRFFKNYILYILNNRSKINEDNDRRMYNQYTNQYDKKIDNMVDISMQINGLNKYWKFCKYMTTYNEEEINNEKFLINSLDFYPFIYSFYENKKEDEYMKKVIHFSTLIYIWLLSKNKNIWKFMKDNLNWIKIRILDNTKEEKQIFIDILSRILFIEEIGNNKMDIDIIWKKIEDDIVSKMNDDSDIYNSIQFKRFIVYFYTKKEEIDNKNEIKLKDKKYNIEHIISKNKKWDFSNTVDIEIFSKVNKIQNLCLIEKEINQKLGNSSFIEKVKIYQELEDKTTIKDSDEIYNGKLENFNINSLNKRKEEINEFSSKFVKNIISKIQLK